MDLFSLIETVEVKKVNESFEGRVVAEDVFDMATGEVFLTKDNALTEDDIERLKDSTIKTIKLISSEAQPDQDLILNTIKKDTSKTKEEALFAIYRQLRSGEAPDVETAQGLIEKLFFNDKRYDLGAVGRFRMNDRLQLNIPSNVTILTVEDIVAIMRYIIRLRNGNLAVEILIIE